MYGIKKTPKKQIKRLPYMREHSLHIRTMSQNGHLTLLDDPVIARELENRPMVVISCRIRQRKLQHAWNIWTRATNVIHNYLQDVVNILSREISPIEKRTELEVEVFFKWALQDYIVDPTGIASSIFLCNSKRRIVNLFQHARLDRYHPGEAIVLQNSVPTPEDGLFTVMNGSVDIVILARESDKVTKLQEARKHNDIDEIHHILSNDGIKVDTLRYGAGFGELSALTKARRTASIVASGEFSDADVLVVSAQHLKDCIDKRRKVYHKAAQQASAEVMDFLRQTGLVHRAAAADVLQAASCISKRTYPAGTLLYKRGDVVDRTFIILSGEIFLDTGDFNDSKDIKGHPFQNANPANCYVLQSGSILGDEGMIGHDRTYSASAVVLSENAVMFEIEGFAISFLGARLGIEKYSALLYKDKSVDSKACDVVLDQIVLHETFNSLRKVISTQNPFRKLCRPVYPPGEPNFTLENDTDNNKGPVESTPLNSPTKITSEYPLGEVYKKNNPTPSVYEQLHHSDASAAGLKVLSSGSIHHLHLIRRSFKPREIMAMKMIAEVSFSNLRSYGFNTLKNAANCPTRC